MADALKNPLCSECKTEELTDAELSRRQVDKMCFYCAYEFNINLRMASGNPNFALPDPEKFGRGPEAIEEAKKRMLIRQQKATAAAQKQAASPVAGNTVQGQATPVVGNGTVIVVNGPDPATSLTFTFPFELAPEAKETVTECLEGTMDAMARYLMYGSQFHITRTLIDKMKGLYK